MRTITVTRYVTPLREGGSMPAVVEGDDLGLYVLKFRGAGQGVRALLAEMISGGIARALGLPIPEIVLAELDTCLAQTEPDPEIQDLVRASHHASGVPSINSTTAVTAANCSVNQSGDRSGRVIPGNHSQNRT